MLERALIDHGSPTLANMKVGSLFTSSCADARAFARSSGVCRQRLNRAACR